MIIVKEVRENRKWTKGRVEEGTRCKQRMKEDGQTRLDVIKRWEVRREAVHEKGWDGNRGRRDVGRGRGSKMVNKCISKGGRVSSGGVSANMEKCRVYRGRRKH